MTTTDSKRLCAADLAQFCGTEAYYRHWTGRLTYTDGVKYMAEMGGAYWLIDAIASYQHVRKLQSEALREFQLWELKRDSSKSSAVLLCKADSGSDDQALIRQEIAFTDFPLDRVTLYVCGGVLLLPSEY